MNPIPIRPLAPGRPGAARTRLGIKAGSAIPGFSELADTWNECSPLPWDLYEDKHAVADAACFLLGPGARKITGQTLHVDGGASVVGGRLMPWEREGRDAPTAD